MSKSYGRFSPDTKNYQIGKAIILFKPDGEDDYFHCGNVPACTITPSVEKIEHFSSMEGTKTKDETIITLKQGEIKMTLEEMTGRNIAMLMLGDVNEDDYGGVTIDLFSRSSYTGALLIYQTNDKGPRWKVDLPKVTFNPSGSFGAISDEYNNMELTGDWESLDGDFGTMTLLDDAGTVEPDNVLLPFISGRVREDEELTAWFGAWVGASSYTYQWKRAGSPIALNGTSKTYTLVTADVGQVITVTVTATNTIGSTAATSAATVAVASAEA